MKPTTLFLAIALLASLAQAKALRCEAGQPATATLAKTEDCPSKWAYQNVEATCVDVQSAVLGKDSATPLTVEGAYDVCVEPVAVSGTYFALIHKIQARK